MKMNEFSHIDENHLPQMVNISKKKDSLRTATAESLVFLPESIQKLLTKNEINTAKGPVFHTAIVAGVMAAKRTHELIPFCHPLGLLDCTIDIRTTEQSELLITCKTQVISKTGVEMEALTGCTVAALTVYDMCKSISHNIIIKQTRLVRKTGGKTDIVQ